MLWALVVAVLVVASGVLVAGLRAAEHVAAASAGRVFTVEDVPEVPIAMVLGTRALPDGPDESLAARLDLAIELWQLGRIRAVLVTGDGRTRHHHQDRVMRDYLVAHGIPAGQVVLDPEGYDTYDSCARARDVFGVEEMVILTQGYHLRRAITLCTAMGIDAVGVGDLTIKQARPFLYARGEVRDWLANLKMEWDLATLPPAPQSPFDPALLEAAGLR